MSYFEIHVNWFLQCSIHLTNDHITYSLKTIFNLIHPCDDIVPVRHFIFSAYIIPGETERVKCSGSTGRYQEWYCWQWNGSCLWNNIKVS